MREETDDDFVNEMLALFVETTPVAIEEIETSMQNKTPKTLGDTMHRIKSSLRILKITNLVSMAQELEDLGRKEGVIDIEKTQRFIKILNICLDQMREELS
ncbi:MAG: Hpt domain-containing protein [Cryomorphaceae bacterium]|nr:Hpt domain-containing protein [Cryomorphaceae bacterium]